ncbi:MAG: YkgJ family cysteine cluster protein [Chloroflexi bacterium]|nr:YkgJ family cysteine cluster protein [Chloroflexota bacterium]
MGEYLSDLGEKGEELLTRATYVYRRRSGSPGDHIEATFEAIRLYGKLFGDRYGHEEDHLSKTVVFDQERIEAPPRDLNEVARRLVNGARADRGGVRNASAASVPVDVPRPVELPAALDERETELLRKAMYVFGRKNSKNSASPGEVIVEALEQYLKLFWRWYGEEPDELSMVAVHGQPDTAPAAKDLDEAAKRVVKAGGKCYSRGDCCKRTLGVAVGESEIQAIEKLGHRRIEFLDPESLLNGQRRLKAGASGCTFLATSPNHKSHCRVYGSRPEACRDFFCNRGPP